jgi:hypothetical protein
MIWKDGEVLYNYGSYACIRDFCIDGEDIYACGEINVENQEQKAIVWKNNEVLYEFDYAYFIELYTILKDEENLYFGGAGYYFGKQPDEMMNLSYGVLFKNGEAIEIDPDCTVVQALAVSSNTNAFQEANTTTLAVFPNPVHDRIHIEGEEISKVQVYNALGQLMRTFGNTHEIDLEGLPKGIYALRVLDDNGDCTSFKVVKE